MKAPVTKATSRVGKTKSNSTDARPCALAVKGCKHNRTKHSIFCYGHGRRIHEWAGKPDEARKERLQDLDRWRSFHNYTNTKGAS